MPAFSNSNKSDIIQNVDLMYRRLKVVTGKQLKHEDFLQLFVPAHQQQTFREIAPLLNNRSYGTNVKWPDGTELRFRLEEVPHSSSSPAPPPRLMVLQPDAPAELVESIYDWIAQGGDVSRDCGRVRAVVETLNARCTKSQLRFVWPSILTVMNANPNNLALKEVAQAMHELKAPKDMPQLPQGLGPALRKAAATVAMAALIPNEILDKPSDQAAEVMVSISPGNRHEEPGIGVYWGMM